MIFSHVLCVSDPQVAMAPLASQACKRLWTGFRPATLNSYQKMFQLFLAFLVVVDLSVPEVTSMDILAFMEYLAQSGMSPDHITNHLTAVRSMCILYGVNTIPFRDQRIPLFIKFLKLNRPFAPKISMLIDETLLMQIITVSTYLQFPHIFKTLYLLAFFSFLRLSNILPHTASTFDKTRHLCVTDVIFSDSKAVILLKWSKTFQDRVKTTTVNIPSLGASALCPVKALQAMIACNPSKQDSPLFQVPHGHTYKPLTDSAARKHLKSVSTLLALPRSLMFHDFRRGGASWAFTHGVPVQEIQAQGTWSSDCVWRYISLPPGQTSQVSDAFRSHLSS